MYGDSGLDELDGGPGNDLVQANGDGNKTMRGAEGDNTINGAFSVDRAYGGPGIDTVTTFGGDDIVDVADGAQETRWIAMPARTTPSAWTPGSPSPAR